MSWLSSGWYILEMWPCPCSRIILDYISYLLSWNLHDATQVLIFWFFFHFYIGDFFYLPSEVGDFFCILPVIFFDKKTFYSVQVKLLQIAILMPNVLKKTIVFHDGRNLIYYYNYHHNETVQKTHDLN